MFGRARTKLGIENLESKHMLAGDVLVSFVDGRLLIEGDDAANNIVVTSGEVAGTLVIQGLDGTNVSLDGADPGDPPTPETGLVVAGVTGSVRISLGDGDDTVSVRDVELRRNLAIVSGAGADSVHIGTAEATDGETAVDAAANVNVRGSVTISTGDADDEVSVANASIRGALNILTGDGEDAVSIGEAAGTTEAAASLNARLGVYVALGAGADNAEIINVLTRGAIAVSGGDGADAIAVTDVQSLFLAVRGGSDDAGDAVQLAGLDVGHALIELGNGVDDVEIVDSAFRSLGVALGAGEDSLSISTVSARRALLSGGEGESDELADAGDSTFQRLAVAGFELPPDVNTEPVLPQLTRPDRGLGMVVRALGWLRR